MQVKTTSNESEIKQSRHRKLVDLFLSKVHYENKRPTAECEVSKIRVRCGLLPRLKWGWVHFPSTPCQEDTSDFSKKKSFVAIAWPSVITISSDLNIFYEDNNMYCDYNLWLVSFEYCVNLNTARCCIDKSVLFDFDSR